MKQLKKTLLTLVALLAVTTGAWAQTETLLTTITATAKEQASYSTANVATVSFSYTAEGYSVYNANWGWWGYGWIATVTAAEGYTITKCVFYDNDGASATDSTDPFIVETEEQDKTPKVNGATFGAFTSAGIKSIEVYGYVTPAAASGPEVAWDKAENSGSFTMPGGNVTLEPDYYPQAALATQPTAINDVPATTDGAIVNAGTVANIGETTTAQGTVMYYVSPTALDDAALLALAADQWTADVPTAAGLAQGQAYVYYYVRGNDGDTDETTFSDGDILAANALTVTIAAAPLWNAEFDLTNAPEEDKAGKWSTDIPEGGVVKGTPVTVTYTGTKKVIGVKAEKKAAKPAAEGHALSASVVGEIVGSDGNVYAVADKDNLPEGVTAVAMVAYKSATAGSSLAIALADEGSMNWNSAKSTCASKAAIGGKSWKLPTKDEWEQMFSANGGSTGLKTALSAAGGASSTLQNGYYWSSTEVVLDPEDDPDMAWIYSFGEVRWYWDDMVNGRQVRACLAF